MPNPQHETRYPSRPPRTSLIPGLGTSPNKRQQRINAQLSEFIAGWCSHGISSAKHKTPMQLWIMGMQSNAQSDLEVSKEMYGEHFEDYGVDYHGPLPEEEYDGLVEENVTVPEVQFNLNDETLQLLKDSVNPLPTCYSQMPVADHLKILKMEIALADQLLLAALAD
ncbi:hypothetical protein QZH41_012268 [Actinostola sp. cb2023]|nr:hypothetical protein QZH41_012268 [Actinostola sp. cb2023]